MVCQFQMKASTMTVTFLTTIVLISVCNVAAALAATESVTAAGGKHDNSALLNDDVDHHHHHHNNNNNNNNKNRFTHGWSTTSEATFADMRNPYLWTGAQIADAVRKYRIISLEKCTGQGNGTKTEAAVYAAAAAIKALSPDTKVIFYLATDLGGSTQSCYAWADYFATRSDWWLKDDHGVVIVPHRIDTNVAAARDWWASIPLNGTDGKGNYNGKPVTELIDGVLADSGGYNNIPNVSVARLEALYDNKLLMVGELQRKLTLANNGIVIDNGITMYGPPNADPRTPDDHNLKSLDHVNG